jgi:peptidoglycan-associated lipoprotein
MKQRILLALILLAATPAAVARAQTSTWELGLHGGAIHHDVFDETDTDPTVGFRLARYTAGGWGFGAGMDFADAGERTLEATPVEVRLLHYAAEIDKSFPNRGRTRATLGAGLGGATASYDGLPDVGERTETSLMVPVAAGLKFMNRAAGPSWGLTFGARDEMVFLDDRDPLGNPRDTKVAHRIQGTAGFSFYFGGGTKVRNEARPLATPAPRTDEAADRDRENEARARSLAEIREKIYFDFDRSEIKSPYRETLQRKAEAMRALPDVEVVIEGHADERGSIEYNLALGERRAKAASDYLADLGIDPDRMSIVSYGEERPALQGSGEAVWSQNRRAEFLPSEN